jgi:hypothetical protein
LRTGDIWEELDEAGSAAGVDSELTATARD